MASISSAVLVLMPTLPLLKTVSKVEPEDEAITNGVLPGCPATYKFTLETGEEVPTLTRLSNMAVLWATISLATKLWVLAICRSYICLRPVFSTLLIFCQPSTVATNIPRLICSTLSHFA